MKRWAVYFFYFFALSADSIKTFCYSDFVFNSGVSVSFAAYAFAGLLCIAPVLWFSLILDETKSCCTLRTLALIKIFSIFSAILFLIRAVMENIFLRNQNLQFFYVCAFLVSDLILLKFLASRESKICK